MEARIRKIQQFYCWGLVRHHYVDTLCRIKYSDLCHSPTTGSGARLIFSLANQQEETQFDIRCYNTHRSSRFVLILSGHTEHHNTDEESHQCGETEYLPAEFVVRDSSLLPAMRNHCQYDCREDFADRKSVHSNVREINICLVNY